MIIMLNRNSYRRLNSSMDRPNTDTIERAKELLLYGPYGKGFLFDENVAYVIGQEFKRVLDIAKEDLAVTDEYGTEYNSAWGANITNDGPAPSDLKKRYDDILVALSQLAYDCMFYNVK